MADENNEEVDIFKLAYNSAAAGIAVADLQGTLCKVNPAFLEMWGYEDEDEVVDRSASEFHPDQKKANSVANEVLENGEWEGEILAERKDGTTFPVHVSASRVTDENEDPAYIMSSFVDISERVARERELKSRTRAIEAAPIGVALSDPHQKDNPLTYVNERFEEMTGYAAEEVTGRNCRFLQGEQTDEKPVSEMRDAVDAGESVTVELRNYRKNGEQFWNRVSIAPVQTENGLSHFVGFQQDITERKRYEQELERTTQFLTDTENVGQVGGWEVNLQHGTMQWSDELYRIHGLPLDAEPTPEEGIEFYHPDDRDTIREAFDRLTSEGEPYDLELRIVTAEGEVRWVHTRGEPRYEDDEIVAVHGTLQDITERKEREQELNRSQQIIKNSTDIATIIDPEGTITYVSPAVQDVLGYEPDELIGTDGFGYQPQETSAAVAEAIEHVLENPAETKTVQTQFRRADGSWAWIESTLRNRVNDDVIGGILISSRDITERKEREQKLQRDRVFLERSPAAITVLDEAGVIKYQSPTSERVFGHPAEELKDDLAFEYMHPEDRDSVVEKFTNLVDGSGGSRTAEYRLNDGDGNWRWIQSSATYYLDEPVIDGILVASVDISERKEVEQRLTRQRDNLEVLNKVLRHDIRNDLQLVLTYAETLDHSLETNKEYVDEILTSVRSAIDLTTRAKTVADVMLGAQTELDHFDLRNVLSQEITDTRDSYENALITTDGTIPSVKVPGDEMIGSVFRNLITNAIEHNDKDTPKVTVSAHEADGNVEVCVADNGPGISDERRTEIFEEGKKGLDSSGTGLGLYLVQTLVNRYGGEVRIGDSEPDGAEFVVQLPTIGSRRDD
ncbi:PAS domain S-box protein [Halovenus salina]|uniref:histidine kinase n=1 Tax=Halovenus salina TaxID=1510225 RepID=A0ABD5W3I7_9EURY|nr:PAS domain S-box protein [Halovenus salina]